MAAILFVCSANTCRSPMAAALAGRRLSEAGVGAAVASAGVNARSGLPASPQAVAVMEEMGLSLAGHRSRRVERADLEQADLVLTMEEWHRLELVNRRPPPAARIFTLAAYAGGERDVSDPFGGSLAEYRRCALELDRLVGRALARLLGARDLS